MTKKYKRVGVVMGGPSSEREVSLRSGAAIANGLRTTGYDVMEIDVTSHSLDIPPGVEAVFVALHGEFGEDGTIQLILRERGIPYTGSSPESSRMAFDKLLSKKRFEENGIPTPRYEVLKKGGRLTIPVPVVAKPARQGSSIGVHCVFREADWPGAFEDALKYDADVLVEAFIEGSELTVGVVGDQVLPVLEIRPPQGFYSYDAKYTKGRTEYLVPAPIAADRAERCQAIAVQVFRALECSHMGRIDFRMTPAGELFVLELNSIPGFTETSLLPKAARAAGIEFAALCDRIMAMACVH